jgi:hypothetical protein
VCHAESADHHGRDAIYLLRLRDAFHLGSEDAGPLNKGRLIGQKLLLERFWPDWLVDTGQLGPALRPAGSGADCRTGLSSVFLFQQ